MITDKIVEWIECIFIALGFFSWSVIHATETRSGVITAMGEVMMTRQEANRVAKAANASAIVKTKGLFKRIEFINQ